MPQHLDINIREATNGWIVHIYSNGGMTNSVGSGAQVPNPMEGTTVHTTLDEALAYIKLVTNK